MAFSVTLTDTQQVRVTVLGAVDKKGNPAQLDGRPVFASDEPDVCTFTTDPDDASGMTGIIKAQARLSPGARVTITADADLGEGVKEIVEAGLVQVTGGQAVGFTVNVGAIEEQVEAPAPAPVPEPAPAPAPVEKKSAPVAKKK